MENSDAEAGKFEQEEDEGMENSDAEAGKSEQEEDEGMENSENESGDGVLRDINFDEDDEVIEAEVVRPLY
jgi:hypothetical protein